MMTKLLDSSLVATVVGVVLGFLLGFVPTLLRKREDRNELRKALFRELMSAYEQINYVAPAVKDGQESGITVATGLVAVIGDALNTRVYEASIDRLGKLNEAEIDCIMDAYLAIYQFKRYSDSLRQKCDGRSRPDESHRAEITRLEDTAYRTSQIAFRSCRRALEAISPHDLERLEPKLNANRGKWIEQVRVEPRTDS
ncbi:MAG: hypothetical protein R6U98_31935 [Pirellulaceae bacterium]